MSALRYAMFVGLRYGLAPVVLFCGVVVVASVDVAWDNIARRSTWHESVATVVQSQDRGDVVVDSPFTRSTSANPHGTVSYVVDGETHLWEGRARELGVTALTPGDQIKIYYDPKDPKVISTLVLLGAPTGAILLAGALAFLTFYVWFFWLRRCHRPSGPADLGGDRAGAVAAPVPDRLAARIERVRVPSFDKR
jgi:uncharacterized protein DUF3592